MPLLYGEDAVRRPLWSEFGQSPEVLSGCCKQEFVSRPARTSQPQTGHPKNALQVCEEHLDLFATMPGLLIFWRGSNRSGDIAGIFVEITRYLACNRIRTAALFEFTGVAVLLAGAIEPCPFARDPRSGRCIGSVELLQLLGRRADVAIILTVPGEVRSARRSRRSGSICRTQECGARSSFP
jgi:hypothetical protein